METTSIARVNYIPMIFSELVQTPSHFSSTPCIEYYRNTSLYILISTNILYHLLVAYSLYRESRPDSYLLAAVVIFEIE